MAALVSACAGVPHDASLPITDPNEQFNRGVLHVNQVVLDPPATVIKSVPGLIRDRFQDLDANLKEPRVFANDVLQGRSAPPASPLAGSSSTPHSVLAGCLTGRDGGQSATADWRFRSDLVRLWRAGRQLYRDALFRAFDATRWIGGIVDSVGDPVGWVVGGIFIGWPWTIGSGRLGAVAHLAQWKQAESSSVDFYSFLRSSFYQTRRAQLREALGLPPGFNRRPRRAGRVAGHVGPAGSPGYDIPPAQ